MSDPAEKYRNKVAPEHELAMQAIGMARMMLDAPHVRLQLELVDESERDAHSFGHITDPTLYRDMISSRSFADQMILVRAALTFLKATDEVTRRYTKSKE
jgi:hypothetical protein